MSDHAKQEVEVIQDQRAEALKREDAIVQAALLGYPPIGETVQEAVARIRRERDAALGELRKIRDVVGDAPDNPGGAELAERVLDGTVSAAVRDLIAERDELKARVAELESRMMSSERSAFRDGLTEYTRKFAESMGLRDRAKNPSTATPEKSAADGFDADTPVLVTVGRLRTILREFGYYCANATACGEPLDLDAEVERSLAEDLDELDLAGPYNLAEIVRVRCDVGETRFWMSDGKAILTKGTDALYNEAVDLCMADLAAARARKETTDADR